MNYKLTKSIIIYIFEIMNKLKQILLAFFILISLSVSAMDFDYFTYFLDSLINQNHPELIDALKDMNISEEEKQPYFQENKDFINNPDLIGTIYLYYGGAFGSVYKKNIDDGMEEEYILEFSINPVVDWHYEIFVFKIIEDSPILIASKNICPKNGNAEMYFELVSSNDFFDIVVDSEVITTYYATEVQVLKLLPTELKSIYSTTTLYYDWKDYGKRYMDINQYQDTLTDSQSRRITTNFLFVNNEKYNRKDIKEITVDAIVEEPGRDSEKEISDYEVFKVIKKEENLLIWDTKEQEYKTSLPK